MDDPDGDGQQIVLQEEDDDEYDENETKFAIAQAAAAAAAGGGGEQSVILNAGNTYQVGDDEIVILEGMIECCSNCLTFQLCQTVLLVFSFRFIIFLNFPTRHFIKSILVNTDGDDRSE